jgi:XTP/dITP diphosphohydrolase
MAKNIVLATSNQGKVEEFNKLFSNYLIRPQTEFGIVDIEETGETFAENALLKARHAALQSGLPALADDSGLCVDALQGAPGIYSARYAGAQRNDADNIAKLLNSMKGIPAEKRQAHFVCCLAYVEKADDPEPLICTGEWHGSILFAPRGEWGFGYQPVFYVPEYDCSAAELEPEIKNRISHRAKAVQLLLRS